MLKNSVDESTYTGLADNLKTEYVKTGDKYTLQHDEPAGELIRAKDRERDNAKTLKASLESITAEAVELRAKVATMPNADAIKATAQAEKDAEYAPIKTALGARETQIKAILIDGAAKQLALTIGGPKNADALLPHVTSRLSAKLDGESPTVTILKDGKESALTMADLEKDIREDKRFSALVIATQSTGGAGRPIVGKLPVGGADKAANLATMSPKDLVAILQSK
jgi:hypothetical protein